MTTPEGRPTPVVERRWQFQYRLTREAIVPWLRLHRALPQDGAPILEAGAGYAGALCALCEACGSPGDAFDLRANAAAVALKLAATHVPKVRLRSVQGDLTSIGPPSTPGAPYGLILLRDVIEHVPNRRAALTNVLRLLRPGGKALLTFPPYLSPYGAHQQILSRKALRLPWIQFFPGFHAALRLLEPSEPRRKDMEALGQCRLTRSAFERDLGAVAARVVAERHFLSRPAFRYRYRMPVIAAGPIASIPGLGELLVSGSWYLIEAAS